MAYIKHSLQISADPARVYQIITDIEGAPKHTPDILRIQMLTPGPLAVGSRWNETRKMMNKEVTLPIWVTELRPGEGYSVACETMKVKYVTRFDIEPLINGCLLSLTMDAAPETFMAKLMMNMAKGAMDKAIFKDLESIKLAAEAD